jgi:hypothetical protein
VWCPAATPTNLFEPGIERQSSTAQGLLRCCLNRESAPVPSGRIVHSDWMWAQPRSWYSQRV